MSNFETRDQAKLNAYAQAFYEAMDRAVTDAKQTDVGKQFVEYGAEWATTGGGCLAWHIDVSETRPDVYILSCDEGMELDGDRQGFSIYWGDHWLEGTQDKLVDADYFRQIDIMRIAYVYADLVKDCLTANEFQKLISTPDLNPNDFYDANMSIMEAFEEVMDRDFLPDGEIAQQANFDIANAAMEICDQCAYFTKSQEDVDRDKRNKSAFWKDMG